MTKHFLFFCICFLVSASEHTKPHMKLEIDNVYSILLCQAGGMGGYYENTVQKNLHSSSGERNAEEANVESVTSILTQ